MSTIWTYAAWPRGRMADSELLANNRLESAQISPNIPGLLWPNRLYAEIEYIDPNYRQNRTVSLRRIPRGIPAPLRGEESLLTHEDIAPLCAEDGSRTLLNTTSNICKSASLRPLPATGTPSGGCPMWYVPSIVSPSPTGPSAEATSPARVSSGGNVPVRRYHIVSLNVPSAGLERVGNREYRRRFHIGSEMGMSAQTPAYQNSRRKRLWSDRILADLHLRPIMGAPELGFQLGKHLGRNVDRSHPSIWPPWRRLKSSSRPVPHQSKMDRAPGCGNLPSYRRVEPVEPGVSCAYAFNPSTLLSKNSAISLVLRPSRPPIGHQSWFTPAKLNIVSTSSFMRACLAQSRLHQAIPLPILLRSPLILSIRFRRNASSLPEGACHRKSHEKQKHVPDVSMTHIRSWIQGAKAQCHLACYRSAFSGRPGGLHSAPMA